MSSAVVSAGFTREEAIVTMIIIVTIATTLLCSHAGLGTGLGTLHILSPLILTIISIHRQEFPYFFLYVMKVGLREFQ